MAKPKVLIVDDDPLMVKILEDFVRKTEEIELSGTCENAIEASNLIRKVPVDIILLDVEMPQMSGLEFIETLKVTPEIILITSNEDYAVEAFDLEVTDFMVKPAQYPRFLKAINRALDNLRIYNSSSSKHENLFVKVDSVLQAIPLNEIEMVEAKADYVTIHTSGKRYTVYSTMKGIENKLGQEDFVRVHRSYIVNKSRINSIEDNTLVIGEKLVPVGVTYRERLMSSLNLL